jgi:enoyl-CoA hydratase
MSVSVLVDVPHPAVARITLNRPERLNAIDSDLLDGLYEGLDQVDNDRDIRCVILTGAGRGFCAGADLKGMGQAPGTDGMGRVPAMFLMQQRIVGVVTRMRRVKKPIIAAVNGPAAGGGLAFVLGSDVRIAAASARFSAAFIKIGISGCDISTSWLLPKIVGTGNAHLLMLTGRVIDAETARAMQLVVDLVPDDALMDTAFAVADEIATNTPFGVWMTKEVMWSALEIPGQQAAIDLENRTQVLATSLDDAQAQMESFFSKEQPEYHWR